MASDATLIVNRITREAQGVVSLLPVKARPPTTVKTELICRAQARCADLQNHHARGSEEPVVDNPKRACGAGARSIPITRNTGRWTRLFLDSHLEGDAALAAPRSLLVWGYRAYRAYAAHEAAQTAIETAETLARRSANAEEIKPF